MIIQSPQPNRSRALKDLIMSNSESYIPVKDKLPEPNQMVTVKFRDKEERVKFVTASDGDFFWDNLVDCVYQRHEIDQWKP